MDKPIHALRREYLRTGLAESEADADPLRQFDRWFDAAVRENLAEPNAMTLATVDASGQPAARIVLLKGFDRRGFVFYTDYTSRKGRDLAANPKAALCFWWPQLERQVQIEGAVERVAPQESDDYFATRPRESQLATHVCEQSRVIPGRDLIEVRRRDVTSQFAGRPVPRPERWGGLRLAPRRFEFWQGREHRLHDRLEYLLTEEGWQMRRLSP